MLKEAFRPPYGQIDLLLEQPRFGLAIENKINAAEQPEQLEIYCKYLADKFGDNALLIYLTRDGKKGSSHGGRPYFRISYDIHISPSHNRPNLPNTDNVCASPQERRAGERPKRYLGKPDKNRTVDLENKTANECKSLAVSGCPGWDRTSDQVINSLYLDSSLSFASIP